MIGLARPGRARSWQIAAALRIGEPLTVSQIQDVRAAQRAAKEGRP